jgi:hypothetical protein
MGFEETCFPATLPGVAFVPTDGFYEWKKIGRLKQPYLLTMADGSLFAFAGLWERWRDPASSEVVRTFTIITTEPNKLAAPIHNSMPTIIGSANYATWLGEEPAEKDELLALIKSFPAERMRAFPVDRRVGDPRNEDAGLIDPLRLTGSLPAPQLAWLPEVRLRLQQGKSLHLSGKVEGLRPLYTPRALAAAIPSICRSRRRLVSNSAKTPSMSRKALPAAVLVSIGCSVTFSVTPRSLSSCTRF